MRPTTGTALGGRYRLDRLIAVGGMGEVWVGHDLSLRRSVAVKVLRTEFAGDPGFLERFRTEARNAASLTHPNIAATYDYGEQSGSSYLVMELVDGEPLSDLLEREPVLPEARLLPVLAQTARALDAAHAVGVVHRDVKPGNILLGPGGRVKITDFGVSTAPDQAPMTATGMVMGTAQYLSPEQAVGRPATALSDLYSLGVVAYEALAGKRPFTGPTAVDIAVAHVNDPVPPLPPHVSRPVADVVRRLLAKDPADRPASAGALARTLDALAGHTPPDGVPDVAPATAAPSAPPAAPSAAHPAQAAARGAASGAPRPTLPPAHAPASRPPSPAPRAPSPAPRPPSPAPRPPSPASSAPSAASVDARRVPGTSVPAAAAPLTGGPPPSYPPRREVRDPRTAPSRPPTAPAAAGTRGARASAPAPTRGTGATAARASSSAGGPPGRGPTSGATPVRTSTTTGQRFGRLGRWSWPLVGLVVLLVALLVASLTGDAGATGAAAAGTVDVLQGTPGPGARGDDGMIEPGAPPRSPVAPTPSTPKDA